MPTYYQRNKERVKARVKARYETIKQDPEKFAKMREVHRESLRKWRAKNYAHFLEDARIRQRKYRKEHSERARAKDKRKHDKVKADPIRYDSWLKRCSAWGRKNTERRTAIQARWRLNHPELNRSIGQRRRARNRGAQGNHTVTQWLARVEFYGWRCAYCTKRLTPKTLTKDHVIPLFDGGTHWASNLVPACLSCNSGKGTKRKSPARA